jgi:hypothetical protein
VWHAVTPPRRQLIAAEVRELAAAQTDREPASQMNEWARLALDEVW